MNHLIPHMQTILPGFNERAFTEVDFYRIATAEDIYRDYALNNTNNVREG